MQIAADEAFAGRVAQRLDQFQRPARRFEAARLEQALGIFAVGGGVLHHGAADAQLAAIAGNRQRSYRNIETRGTVGREMADGPAIDAARAPLQLSNDLHSANLRRAGDRTAGEQRAHQCVHARAGFEPRRHGGHHLMHRWISLDSEHVFDRHAADLGDPAQIVAQQIDDHQILGAVLGAGGKPRARLGVGGRVCHSRGGALHRTRRDLPIAGKVEKQFRRKAEDLPFAVVEIGAVRRGGCGAQAAVQRQRIAEERETRAETQIRLIEIARRDEIAHPLEALAIGLGIPFVHQGTGIGAAFAPGIERGIALETLRRLKHSEPQQRHGTGGRHQRHQPRFQRIAKLIGKVSRDMPPGGALSLDRGQRGGHLARHVRPDRRQRPHKGLCPPLGGVVED